MTLLTLRALVHNRLAREDDLPLQLLAELFQKVFAAVFEEQLLREERALRDARVGEPRGAHLLKGGDLPRELVQVPRET